MASKVYGGKVEIVEVPSGRKYAQIKDASETVFIGPWRHCRDDAIRDAAGWLEDQGFVHPMTHDVVKR